MRLPLGLNVGISYKLVKASVILTFVVGFVMSLVQLYWDYELENRTFVTTINRILDVSEPPAARAVHLLDNELAMEVVNGLLHYDFITSVQVYDDLNSSLANKTRAGIVSSTRWITKKISTEFQDFSILLNNKNSELSSPGRLVIVVDMDAALTGFFDRSLFVLVMAFVRNILVVLLLFAVFYWVLTKPLVELAESIGKLSPRESGKNVVNVHISHEDDELGLIARRVNHFNTSLRRLLAVREKKERELIQSKEELEGRAQALVVEVSQREKAEHDALVALADAKVADRSKSEFLANMSHELRTPLNAVIGFSSIMREQLFGVIENKKYLEYSNDIYNASTHLLQMINEVLDVAKIEVGDFVLTEEHIDTKALVDSVLRTLQPTIGKKAQTIKILLPENNLILNGDITRVRQILLNLLTNSFKFTSIDGDIVVCIELTANRRIQMSVKDTGIGIPSHELENILKPFTQVDNAFSRGHDGVGLGLSLCKSLVDMHEGDLSLTSIEGVGTTVLVTFPAIRTVST